MIFQQTDLWDIVMHNEWLWSSSTESLISSEFITRVIIYIHIKLGIIMTQPSFNSDGVLSGLSLNANWWVKFPIH